MIRAENIYLFLCTMFSVLLVMGNLIYQKIVSIDFFHIHTFELSVGAILYPLTFLLSDLITEFYGKEKARFCVKLGISMNVLVVLLLLGMDQLHATSWSKLDDQTFHQVFGMYGIAFLGSMIACFVGQMIDIKLYAWIKLLTKGKWIWIRNNLSTGSSLLIDTTIVISFLTLFKVLPFDQIGNLIFNSYIFKLCFTVCCTPIFYLLILFIKRISKN